MPWRNRLTTSVECFAAIFADSRDCTWDSVHCREKHGKSWYPEWAREVTFGTTASLNLTFYFQPKMQVCLYIVCHIVEYVAFYFCLYFARRFPTEYVQVERTMLNFQGSRAFLEGIMRPAFHKWGTQNILRMGAEHGRWDWWHLVAFPTLGTERKCWPWKLRLGRH